MQTSQPVSGGAVRGSDVNEGVKGREQEGKAQTQSSEWAHASGSMSASLRTQPAFPVYLGSFSSDQMLRIELL